jgi:hypothetical protein
VTKLNSNEWWFSPLFRLVGYGLLLLALFDIVDIFIPPLFSSPVWEFQMARNLVERVPVPLLGVLLVFSSETNFRIFKFLSWACLVVGVLFLLLLPLGLSTTWRLDQQQMEISSQINQRKAQVQQINDQLSKATTAEQIGQVLTRLNPQSPPPQINNPEELKSRLLAELAQAQGKLTAQSEENRANLQGLIKAAIKSNLGALVSGIVFINIWRSNRRALKVNRHRE